MKRKVQPTFNELCDALQHRPAPRSQSEWRATSTAMRQARAANTFKAGRMIYVECGSFARRIYLESTWGGMRCYNGPSPLGALGMIGHHRFMYLQGLREGRVADARDCAKASRRYGSVPIP